MYPKFFFIKACNLIRIRLLHELAVSNFLYDHESWTLTAEVQQRIQALEKDAILGISKVNHITNDAE